MLERYSTVRDFCEVLYNIGEMKGKLVRDHKTRIEYEVVRLTSREVRCAEVDGGSVMRFDPKYFGHFEVLNPEMYDDSR